MSVSYSPLLISLVLPPAYISMTGQVSTQVSQGTPEMIVAEFAKNIGVPDIYLGYAVAVTVGVIIAILSTFYTKRDFTRGGI